MTVVKYSRYWSIVFRPFKVKLVKIATKETQERLARRIGAEIVKACRSGDYCGLTDAAREVCVRMFLNQKWEIPPDLVNLEFPNGSIEPVEPRPVMTFGNAMKRFFEYPEIRACKAFQRYKYSFQNLIPFFKDRPLAELTIPLIKEYRLYRLANKAAPATVNKEVGALSKMFGVLQELKVVSDNPVKSIESLSEISGERESYIGAADFQLMLTRVSDWFRPIIQCAYYTGMRRGEIVKLRRDQVSLERRMIYIRGTQSKEQVKKKIPIARDLERVLRPIMAVPVLHCPYVFTINGHQTNPESFKRQWRNATSDMQPRPIFKDLRATFKTNAWNSGVDEEVREAIMGHEDGVKSVKRRYGYVMETLLIESIDMISWDHGPTNIVAAIK